MSKWLFIEPGRIGDWIVATVAVSLMTEKLGIEVDWAVRGEVMPLLDKSLPYNEAVAIPDGVGLNVLPGLLSGIFGNRKQYDGCCVLSQGRSGAMIAALSKAKNKCGYLGLVDPYNKSTPSRDCDMDGNDIVYNPLSEHLLVRCLKPLGSNAPEFVYSEMSGKPEFIPELALTEDDMDQATKTLSSVGVKDEPFVLISVGSRWKYKEWPQERWIKMIKILCDSGVKVLAAGAPADYERLRKIDESVGHDRFNVVGPLSLPVYAGLVSLSSVLVCHDSGPMHMAAAVGANLAVIYGPTDPIVTGPLCSSDNVKIVKADHTDARCPCLVPSEDPHKGKICESGKHECMSKITEEQVVAAVDVFLK